jgi:hypothetical protein
MRTCVLVNTPRDASPLGAYNQEALKLLCDERESHF